MRIDEIPDNNEIKIKITTVDASTEVDTSVKVLSDTDKKALNKLVNNDSYSFTALELIKRDGKTLGFTSGKNVLYTIGCTVGGKYYTWENVLVKTIKLPGGALCYIVLSKADVQPSNRRNAFRLWIGEDVTFTLGLNNNRSKAVLRDLSATGLGLIVSDAEGFRIDKMIHVYYTDRDNVSFNFSCKVVNITELSEAKILIGCMFLKRSQTLDKYISKKQIERAKDKNRS